MFGIATGNFLEGHEMYGPFPTEDEASSWAATTFEAGEDWWPFELCPPGSVMSGEGIETADDKPTVLTPEELKLLLSHGQRENLPLHMVADLSELPA